MKYRKILAVLMAFSCLSMVGCDFANSPANSSDENSDNSTAIVEDSHTEAETASLLDTSPYAEKLSEKNVMEINIISDEWDSLMQNATSKPWVSCDIEIDGERFENVGIKTKGNTSLSQIAQTDTERYSLKVKFDKYVDGQSYYGLDKLALNNIYSDNTYLKEYISYDLFQFMDVPSSLCRFTKITVNGEYYGFYIAIEDPDDSFIERNYGEDTSIKAYKPEAMEMNGKDGIGDMPKGDMFSSMLTITDKNGNEVHISEIIEDITKIKTFTLSDGTEITLDKSDMRELMQIDFTEVISITDSDGNTVDLSEYTIVFDSFDNREFSEMRGGRDFSQDGDMPEMRGGKGFSQNGDMPEMPDDMDFSQNGDRPQMPDGENGFKSGGMDGGRDGVNLVYSDDEISSYCNIFDNNITKIDDTDKTRLIASLKGISEGENLENYINIDEILRYTACNVFLTNLDSYFGTLCHNYILMEDNGVLSMIPWDYNLAFGTNQCKNSSEAVNYAIDTVFSGVTAEERPIIGKLLENEEYFQKYHEYLQKICTEYVQSGLFAQKIDEMVAIIDDYVKQDTTAFCSYEEYQEGVVALKLFGELRAESISGQLDGSIPATTEEQNNSTALIDTSDLNLEALGSMNQGGKGSGMNIPNGNMPNDNMPNDNMPNSDMPNGDMSNGNMPNGDMPNGDMPNGDMPNGDMPNGDMPNTSKPDRPTNVSYKLLGAHETGG
ncbi:MAG: CotH kinase family protein, partial [Oscillospiraceae bacterium]|nr:CotH kinase family protein [Oscillospiraceae bacterium]